MLEPWSCLALFTGRIISVTNATGRPMTRVSLYKFSPVNITPPTTALSLFETPSHLVRHKAQLHSTGYLSVLFPVPFYLPLFSSLRPNVIRTVLLCHHKDMLARGRNDAQSTNQFAATSGVPGHAHPAPVAPQRINPSQQMSSVHWGPIGSARGMSMISVASDESEQVRLNTRGMGKRNPSPTNGRRKADEPTVKAPTNKKSKTNAAATNSDMDFSDEGSTMGLEESVSISKMTNEEKRKNFLERNRVAAHKCRLRRKQWLTQLQTKAELFTTENDTLMAQIAHLREETVNMKTLLFAHKDCPVAYQQELYSASMSQLVRIVAVFLIVYNKTYGK
ncbi:hypothetical protein FOXB_03043, partial [Fusarium oxysporum f. sp. conglutinans Fo5176]